MEWFVSPELAVIAYTAGLMDGEGSVSYHRKSSHCGGRFSVSICQSDLNDGRTLCCWLQEEWGVGRIYQRRLQYGAGPYSMWFWTVCPARDVQHLLSCLLPYLRVKRVAAEAALGDIEQRFAAGHRYHWAKRESEYLLAHWDETDQAVGQAIGRGERAIRHKRRELQPDWIDRRAGANRRSGANRVRASGL